MVRSRFGAGPLRRRLGRRQLRFCTIRARPLSTHSQLGQLDPEGNERRETRRRDGARRVPRPFRPCDSAASGHRDNRDPLRITTATLNRLRLRRSVCRSNCSPVL